MSASTTRWIAVCLAPLLLIAAATTARSEHLNTQPAEKSMINVRYLEIVTPAVDETCDVLAKAHGVVFGRPIVELGNARTADLKDGGRIGVRAPMHSAEQPTVRPYVLVDDIETALQPAKEAGAEIAIPGMQIPGHGTIAIYILGGIEHGLWQR